MSYVILLRLKGTPYQSWGTDSKFETRATGIIPSKSGVCGMIAAALGYDYGHDLTKLRKLRFGVRADDYGRIENDYQTVDCSPTLPYKIDDVSTAIKNGRTSQRIERNIRKPKWNNGTTKISKRTYISGGVFIVAIESESFDWLSEIANALQHPVYTIFLGRKCCPVNADFMIPAFDECSASKYVNECRIEDAFSLLPIQSHLANSSVDIYVEPDSKNLHKHLLYINDNPVLFGLTRRKYERRAYYIDHIDMAQSNGNNETIDDDFFSCVLESSHAMETEGQ